MHGLPPTSHPFNRNPGNKRPISIIAAVMKMFEHSVHNQLSTYMKLIGLRYEEQSGFQPLHSTCS